MEARQEKQYRRQTVLSLEAFILQPLHWVIVERCLYVTQLFSRQSMCMLVVWTRWCMSRYIILQWPRHGWINDVSLATALDNIQAAIGLSGSSCRRQCKSLHDKDDDMHTASRPYVGLDTSESTMTSQSISCHLHPSTYMEQIVIVSHSMDCRVLLMSSLSA
jgi:hypothetical protein